MEEEKSHFSQILEEQHKQKMDDLRRSWRDHLTNFQHSKEIVSFRYDELSTRLEKIISSIESKIINTKQVSNNLKANIESLQRLILKSQTVKEQQMNDDNSEQEVEVTLKHHLANLKHNIATTQTNSQLARTKSERYKLLYLRTLAKQRTLRDRERDLYKLRDMQAELSQCFSDFLHHIEEESNNLARDSASLRVMRNELLRVPLKGITQSNTENAHAQLLAAASPPSCDVINTSAFISADASIALEGRQSVLSKDRKIQLIEDNIRALISTGNYTEKDPIIVSLRKKISELS